MGAIGGFTHESNTAVTEETWLTPRAIIEDLGPFDLDPCAAPEPRPWPTARRHIVLPEDGLLMPWEGFVWMNPPYGRQTYDWMNRLANHGNGIALIFARVETDAFEVAWKHADAVTFLPKRVEFCRRDGSVERNAGTGSALIGFGRDAVDRLRSSRLGGILVEHWTVR